MWIRDGKIQIRDRKKQTRNGKTPIRDGKIQIRDDEIQIRDKHSRSTTLQKSKKVYEQKQKIVFNFPNKLGTIISVHSIRKCYFNFISKLQKNTFVVRLDCNGGGEACRSAIRAHVHISYTVP
jgi:hypothetical protein